MIQSVNIFMQRVGIYPGTGLLLGVALKHEQGWKFYPRVGNPVTGKAYPIGRKFYPEWEDCLPKWTGGLNGTTSSYTTREGTHQMKEPSNDVL